MDIARDAKKLTNNGWPLAKIREYVDTTYSGYGPGTDTPPVASISG